MPVIRSLSAKPFVRGLLSLMGLVGALAGTPVMGWAESAPSGAGPGAKKVGDNWVYTCNNLHFTCYPDCKESSGWRCSQDSSIINHAALWHTHFATDYAILNGADPSGSGCAPCGATRPVAVGALPGLTFGRYHNYAFTGQQSSFGPGVYSSYDVSLELSTAGYWWTNQGKRTIRVVDPASGPFVESTYDNDWAQVNFSAPPALARVDATVDFDWGGGSPGTGVGADNFGALWTGSVIPTATETYTFYTTSDDGVKLWVNGQLLINNWTDHAPTENSATISLTAGQPYSIRMEMYERGGGAVAKLSWSSPSTSKSIIPSTALRTAANASGLDAAYVNAGAEDGIYHDNDPNGGRVFRNLGEIKLLDANGALTTDHALGVTAVLRKLNGDLLTFEVFRTSTDPNTTERFARLKTWADRNGNTQTLNYLYPVTTTPAAAGGDLAKLWMLSSIADAHGRSASVTYRPTQVAGRWVVESIGIPNGSTVTYQYNTVAPGLLGLSGVTYPDGTVSSISGSYSTDSQCQVIHYDDAGAESTHRRKDVHLTVGTWTDPVTSQINNQAVGRVRLVLNGAGETSWYSQLWSQANGTKSHLIYRGGQKLLRLDFGGGFDGREQRVYYASAFNFANDPSTFTWELDSQNITMDQWYRVTGKKDALNRTMAYEVDPVTGNTTKQTYQDSTFNTTTYDQFQQPLHEVDRLGRVTDHSYDANGNHLTKTAAVGTAAQATWGWNYNARGQVLNAYDADYSAATPDLHVTSYVYNAAGYLANVVHAADVAGGPRPIYTYAYDAAGRLAQSTDPEGRKAIYTYDLRNRVTRIDYDDGSHEAITYGTGVDANLVTVRRDRNGNLTTFAYDAHGRLTTTTAASGTAVAAVSTRTYLAGTNDLVTSSTVLGETATVAHDFRNRQVATSRTAKSGTTLTSTVSYDNAQRVAWTQDAYGRKTYPVYDVNDRVVRTVRETMPGAIAVGTNLLATLARDLNANAAYLITESVFDAEGQTLASIDARGVRSDFLYDAQGRLTRQTVASVAPAPLTALSYRTDIAYDAQGNPIQITLPRTFNEGQNFITAMTYSGRNLLLATTEAVGRPEQATRTRTYTPTGKEKTDTDFRGFSTTFAYSPCCDRLKTVTDSVGGVTTYSYDGYGNVTSVIDANGNETKTTYDARHRVTTVKQVQENETATYVYDDNGADAVGLSSTYASQLPGLGLAAGSDGSLVEVTNPLGEKSLQIRDGLGRAVRTVDGLGHASTTIHDVIVSGLVESAMTDALGHTKRSRADGAGRVRQSIDAENRTTSLSYDANGTRVSVRDPNNLGQDCVIDAVGRDTQCTDTAGAVTSRVYNAHNQIVSSTDALAKVTTCTFDARDRKVTCLDRIAGTTAFTYDANSNLLTITDAESKVTTYVYDSRNLLISETYPAGQATTGAGQDVRTYTYDLGRRLATRTDQTGLVTTYTYDRANRLTTRSYPDALNDLFTYDDASRLTTATSQRFGTVVTRAYDAASRLTSESQTVGGYVYPVGYAYDDANRATTLTHPNGKQTTRTYTDRNQLATTAIDGAQIASRSYDIGGRFVTTSAGNGLVETRGYNADNTVATLAVPGVTNFGYTYDANKRKTYEGHQFAADLQTFGYDDENRVTAWTRDGQESQNWTLTKVGDWNATTRNGVAQTRTHSDVHETTGITVGAVTTPLTYDAKGNLTRDENSQRYAWDVENRLVAAVVGAATNGYFYDALGRRLAKAANGLATTFVHDGAQVIAEYEAPIYQSQDIGGPSLVGSFSDSTTGTVTVAASGNDIWNNADQFRYAYFTLTGNGSIIAKVTTQTNTDQWAKAGVMLRDSLAADAKHAFMCITPGNGAAFQRRLTAGGSSSNNHTGGGSAAVPYWVCLTRNGTTVSGYRSADGVAWTLVGSDTLSFTASTVYVGLAVTSHTNGAVSTATFTNVAATGWVTTSASPTLARSYVYGSYVDELLAIVSGSGGPTQTKYAHSNHLYSVAALSDNTGAVVERYRYDAYGQRTVLAADGVTTRTASLHGNQVGFTGRYLDKETGLWYFRYRYYSGSLGRFIGRDPVGYINGSSLYNAYFAVHGTDPFGLWDCATVVTWTHVHYLRRLKKGGFGNPTYGRCNRWYPEGCYATDPDQGLYLPEGGEAEYGSEPDSQLDLETGLLERPPGDSGISLPGPDEEIHIPGAHEPEGRRQVREQLMAMLTKAEKAVKDKAEKGDCCKCKEYCLYFIFIEMTANMGAGDSVTLNARGMIGVNTPGWSTPTPADVAADPVLQGHVDSWKEDGNKKPLDFFYYKKCFPCKKK